MKFVEAKRTMLEAGLRIGESFLMINTRAKIAHEYLLGEDFNSLHFVNVLDVKDDMVFYVNLGFGHLKKYDQAEININNAVTLKGEITDSSISIVFGETSVKAFQYINIGTQRGLPVQSFTITNLPVRTKDDG